MNRKDNIQDTSDDGMCKFHLNNQVYILCETCDEIICDKCLNEQHVAHHTEDFKIAQNNDFVFNLFTNFCKVLKRNKEEQLKNFHDKINNSDKMVERFLSHELGRVEKTTQELMLILENLIEKVKKLISMYQHMMKKEFASIIDEYERFEKEITNFENRINIFKTSDIKGARRIREFKDLKNCKKVLEEERKTFYSFYNFNKTALISEFSLKEFYSNLDKNKSLFSKQNEEYNKLLSNLNMKDKINKVTRIEDSNITYSSKNVLPRNICRIFQPIDRTNKLTIYDIERERFQILELFPKKLVGYSFLPFCRYLNFNGFLFISGGYEDSRLNRSFWAIEEKNELNFESTLNIDKNCIYEVESEYQNLSVIKCASMINPRAGHAMIGYAPSIIFVFGGTESVLTCEMYNLDTNKWEEIASLNDSRIDPSVLIFKNFIYVFFGLMYDKSSKRYSFLDSIERISLLHLQTTQWEFVNPKFTDQYIKTILPRSLCGIVLKSNCNSIIYLCGGQIERDKYSTDIFEFDLEENIISYSDKKLPKPTAFLEQNFLYLLNTGVNYDIYGDIFYYHNKNDKFNFHFQNLK